MSNFRVSNILRSDSYKYSHWKQYPAKTENVYSYFESRGGPFSEIVPFGLTYYLKEYLSQPITKEDVEYAQALVNAHIPANRPIFNLGGFDRIVNKHGGFLPIVIKAVPEGTPLAPLNVLLTVENTDKQLPWMTNFAETMLSELWYPSTVATMSREIKKVILKYLRETGNPALINFKLHDFGYRGVSSQESALIGGMAHLINFMGSDTIIAVEGARHYYGEDMAGFSVPASEHSTITSWGQEHEYDAFNNMITQFGDGLFACVSDSYSIYDACENLWGTMLKNKILRMKGNLVVRPDSGIPHVVSLKCLEILGSKFGFHVNDKGYKVLNDKVRVIYGDGIDLLEIGVILETLKKAGWSADNIAFGCGGGLLQKMDRDTCKFAFKCSSIVIDGQVKDVWKQPSTDSTKVSKKGRLKLILNEHEQLQTVSSDTIGKDILQTVWKDGELLVDPTFAEIRARAELI